MARNQVCQAMNMLIEGLALEKRELRTLLHEVE